MQRSRHELLEAFEVGRAAWPDVALSFDDFASRIEALDVASEDLAVRAPDLFLAIACGANDAAAIRNFDSTFLASIERRVARFDLPAHKIDDLCQRIRMKLFVGSSPGISGYRGRAPLGAWLQVTAVRVAIDVAAIAPPAGSAADLLGLAAPDQNPEIETVRKLYEDRFREALDRSFEGLTGRERTILRLHVVDGLNIDAIGAIYAVHRATAARWLVGIRARVFEMLKREFALKWKTSSSELSSLVRLFRDQIDITAKRVLGSGS